MADQNSAVNLYQHCSPRVTGNTRNFYHSDNAIICTDRWTARIYIRSETRKLAARGAFGAVFHPVDSALSRLQFRGKNVLVLRELAVSRVFCIIYIRVVHAAGFIPTLHHVAYTDHINASQGIVVFYGELRPDFSSLKQSRGVTGLFSDE